ncbi:MAG: serine hydrolase [Acidobacteriota bacterium]
MPPRANLSNVETTAADAAAIDSHLESFLAFLPATPGLALGLVRPGSIYLRGFGYRDLATCAPVTPATSFYLLSVTKSFTGMLMALLQYDGEIELEWDLKRIWPDLEMPPPINPAQITLRDLLLHAPGFDNGGINYRTYAPGNLDSDGVVRLLSEHSEPASRSFAYRNTGYIVAATAVEATLGQTWRELLLERLFEPLGMKDTTPYIEIATAGEFALPYSWTLEGDYRRQPVKQEQQMHAAGGVVSNVNDLVRWLQVMLARGELDGRRVLPARVVDQALAPQIQLDKEFYKFSRFAYGLGVYLADYEGDLLIHHFGGPIHLSFMPEHGIGVVVLTNGTGASLSLAHMIAAYLYDYSLAKPDLDSKYAAEIERVRDSTQQRLETRAAELQSLRDNRNLERLSKSPRIYVGTFRSDRLGEMEVVAVGERLVLTYGVLTAPMIPYQEDRFLVHLEAADLPQIFEFRRVDDAAQGLDTDDGSAMTILDWGGRIFERIAP